MPGLIAFNRRWGVGSDDFVFPGFGEIVIRTVWLVAVVAVYIRQKVGFTCAYGYLLHTYCIGMIIILAIHLILSVIMIGVSARGTVVDFRPRKHLPAILYCKLFMMVPELVITLLGTIWAFDLENNCDKTVVFALRATAIAGWVVLVCLLVGIVFVFDPTGGKKHRHDDMLRTRHQQRMWQNRCRWLCCCANQDENSAHAFSDISNIITDFFKDLDVVATDVAAGLLLMGMEQKKKPKRLRLEPITTQPHRQVSTTSAGESNSDEIHINVPPTIESINDDQVFPRPHSWMTIPQATHYMQYASGSYGWALYTYSHLSQCLGLCKLCPACTCCACLRSPSHITDDNCCGCNTAAIIKTTGIRHEDIIYASYYNRIYQIPFFVVLDHREKAVVVSVRGTLSLRDAVTDLTADSELLETPGVEGGHAHKGILQAAQYIHNTIQSLHLLEQAFNTAPGYQLVITGHSLGAGAASILAILLRQEFPQLKCFAFSPPGWLISLSLARYTEDFICSVVVGSDLVPRLGFINMENLKTGILTTIRKCQKPKYQILASGVWAVLKDPCGSSDNECAQPSTSGDSSTLADDRTSLVGASSVRRYTEGLQYNVDPESGGDSSGRSTLQIDVPLYMPGHVLYIEEIQPRRTCCDEPVYKPAWARPEAFDEILVSPKMIHDHLPDVVSRALKQLSGTLQPCHHAHTFHSETAVV